MLNVLLTIDTEIWPLEKADLWSKQWTLSPKAAAAAFQSYIIGKTGVGSFGVPFQLGLLKRFNCKAVFFVEPLFSRELGRSWLEEIVEMIRSADQDIELHLHPEWNEKGGNPLIPDALGRGMSDYSKDDQSRLIEEGVRLLSEARADRITAFRAGSYKCNLDSLRALKRVGIPIDSSFNAAIDGSGSTEFLGTRFRSYPSLEGVREVPVTVFEDYPGHLRHAQLNACSFSELSSMLNQAWRYGYSYFVIVSHSFELLNPGKTEPDRLVIRRFERLLEFLYENPERFRTVGFKEAETDISRKPPARSDLPGLRSNVLRTGLRVMEQGTRRVLSIRRNT